MRQIRSNNHTHGLYRVSAPREDEKEAAKARFLVWIRRRLSTKTTLCRKFVVLVACSLSQKFAGTKRSSNVTLQDARFLPAGTSATRLELDPKQGALSFFIFTILHTRFVQLLKHLWHFMWQHTTTHSMPAKTTQKVDHQNALYKEFFRGENTAGVLWPKDQKRRQKRPMVNRLHRTAQHLDQVNAWQKGKATTMIQLQEKQD